VAGKPGARIADACEQAGAGIGVLIHYGESKIK
jgi:hypothetical protein